MSIKATQIPPLDQVKSPSGSDKIPGPNLFQVIRGLKNVQQSPITAVTRLHERYGSLVKIAVSGRKTYLVSDADLVKYILQDNNRNYRKQAEGTPENPLVGNGLLTSEGGFWRRQRRLAQPVFHRQKIALLAEAMAESTGSMLDRWTLLVAEQNSQAVTFDMAHEMMKLTLEIVVKTLFSQALTDAEMNAVMTSMPNILRGSRQQMLRPDFINQKRWLPVNQKYRHEIAQLDKIIYRIIQERRESGVDKPDLLGMLLAAEDADTGEKMSDRQLRDESMTIFLAGHETTANLLAWCWHLLGENKGTLHQVQAEVEAELAGQKPTMSSLAKLTFTHAVLEETLRLYPPAWIMVRSPIEADRLHQFEIEAESTIMISPYILHRSPAYWKNPEQFDPSRFEAAHKAERHRFAYIPFGAGPRLCIGNQFAMMEAKLILAMMVQRFQISPAVDAPAVMPETAITLRPRDGVWVQIRPRI